MLMSFWSCEVQKPQQIYSAVAKMKDLFCVCLGLYDLACLMEDPASLLLRVVEGGMTPRTAPSAPVKPGGGAAEFILIDV